MYVKTPFPLTPVLNEKTLLYLFNYAGNDDQAIDFALYQAELSKHFLYNQGTPVAEYGIKATGTQLTISAAATARTIQLAGAGEDITTECAQYPVVKYKGDPIPFSDYDTVATAQGLITLKAGTTSTYTSTTATDYVVYYTDPVLGIVTSAEIGGVSLPIETSEFNTIGQSEPAISTRKRGDVESQGSLTVLANTSSILFDGSSTPANNPGEEIEARIYGSDWVTGSGISSANRVGVPTNPFGVALLMFSGEPKDLGATTGRVWLKFILMQHCELLNINAPENVDASSTDPVLQTIEFQCRFGQPHYGTILVP